MGRRVKMSWQKVYIHWVKCCTKIKSNFISLEFGLKANLELFMHLEVILDLERGSWYTGLNVQRT